MRTETPEHDLDPPDDQPCTRDAEVLRLKEDVRALRGLLSEATIEIGLFKYLVLKHGHTEDVPRIDKLQDRIDAELNG